MEQKKEIASVVHEWGYTRIVRKSPIEDFNAQTSSIIIETRGKDAIGNIRWSDWLRIHRNTPHDESSAMIWELCEQIRHIKRKIEELKERAPQMGPGQGELR